jgi:hypothetical protein
MKKFITLIIIAFTFILEINAQCSCTATNYASIDVNCWTPGQSANITTCQFGGERATIFNTLAGAVYRISSCGAGYDSQLSIYTTGCTYVAYNDDNGPACSGTAASVQFTSPGGNLYSVFNQYNCATNTTCTNISIQLISLPDYTPATSFGSNVWNVYGYLHAGYNFANQMNLTGVHYRGFYTDGNLNINSTARWGTNDSPSFASGWSGCSVTTENHTVVYKRQGFPCGVYQIDLNNHDDGVRCYVDGVQIYQVDGCCADRGIIYTGYLGASSTVEFRVSEGGGGSNLFVDFIPLTSGGNSNPSLSASVNPICQGASNGEITVKNPLYHNYNFSTTPAGMTLYQNASLTSGRIQLTPNAGGQQGFATFTNNGHNVTSFRASYNITNVGADGYTFSYANNIAASIPGTNTNIEEVGVGNGLSLNFDYYQDRIRLRYNGTNIYDQAYSLGADYAVVFTVDEVGRASLTLNGSAIFTNLFISASYYTSNKSNWQFLFGGRTGGVAGLHSIDNLFIGEYEYSSNGSTWQTNPVFTGLSAGALSIQRRLLLPVCSTSPVTIGSKTISTSSSLSAAAISPKCVGGSDGSIDLSVSGAIHGARVVKIVQLDNKPFNTNEIQVFQVGTGTNVALASLGSIPAMSSDPYGGTYPVTWLNDGNTNNGVGAHTATGVGEWQKVSWEEPVSLDRIVIWNRDGCCWDRLNNIRLEVYGDLAETNLLLSQNVNANNGNSHLTPYTFSPVNYFSNATSTYAWSNSATTEDITGLSAGTYSVTVTDDYGCVNTLSGITVTAPASHTLSAVVTNEVCPADNNGAINLTVNSPRVSAEPPAFSGLSIWTKADAGIVKNKEGKVIQWQDLSGNDNHFKTTYGTNIEEVSSAIGGNPAVRFNATNIMQSTFDLNSNFTVIVVGKLNGGANERLVSSATNNWLLGWWGGNINQFYSEGWVHNPGTSANTNAYIYTGTGNLGADSYALYSNGTNLATNNGGSQAPRRLSLGGWGANNTELSNGDVAEVIVYNRVLTNDERMAIEKYLANKYSITISHAGVNPTYSWSPGGATTEDIASLNAGSYTVTVTDVAGCTTQGTYTVGTDKTESTAPTGATASSTFSCSASAVDLTAVGGSLGTGATWEWYSDASFTTSVGSGSPLTVYPTANTTYYVRAEGDCNNTSAQSVAVFINGGSAAPGGSVSLASSTSASTCVVNDNNWHYYYNSSGELLAAINSNNQNLGNVTVEITVGDDGPFGQGFSPGVCGYTGVSDGEYVVPRYWDITVDNQPSSAVDVIFYYNSADVTTLVNTINTLSADYVTCWGDVNSESDLMMTVNHTGGGTELFASLSPSAGPAAGQRQIAFSLSEFSGGKLHSNGGLTGAGNALPVELISFTAKAVNNQFIQLNWSTFTEINNEGFAIERSD